MQSRAIYFVIIVIWPLWAWGDDTYQSALDAYEDKDYQTTIKILKELLEPVSKLESKEDEIHARKILAASYFWEEEYELVDEQFRKLLSLEPNTTLHSFNFVRAIRDRFEQVRGSLQAVENRLIREEQEKRFTTGLVVGSELLQRQIALTPKFFEVIVEQHIPALSFVPFLGQLQNGDNGRALVLLGAEALALGTNVGTFLYLKKFTRINEQGQRECLVDDRNPDQGPTGLEYCQIARNFNVGSLVVAVGILGLSVLDARQRFVPEVRQLKEISPKDGRKLLKQSKRVPVRITPFLGEKGKTGFALSVTF